MAKQYVRQSLEGYIIKALQSLGGSASKIAIKEEIIADDSNDISYEMAYTPVLSKSGRPYNRFNIDIGFGLINLRICGYIENYDRRGDVTLTQMGRTANYAAFPSNEDKQKMRIYWKTKDQERAERKSKVQVINDDNPDDSDNPDDTVEITIAGSDDSSDTWKVMILEQINQFSPQKFESFSRLLLSRMGIKFDNEKGIKMSCDHGIDGYGYFESDEFRTSRVVIQCKRFKDTSVSEPEIDKFKGVMTSFNADYGIFITTSFFTKQAKLKAMQGGNTVTLIDGPRLIDLIEKYQLNIKPIQTYVLEDYYYQKD